MALALSCAAQDGFLGNKEVQRLGIPMIARSFAGSMAAMEGVITLHLVKLTNGDYLYDPDFQLPQALEFNNRLCATSGGKAPARIGKMVLGSDERSIPLYCEAREPLARKDQIQAVTGETSGRPSK